ncbi:hypothetical protein TVAG_485260 [Trichomonas vaginalis G3]|uniref:Uncharacterized protein n=1 Tax=Trichomonas vaginalis (strain ATCC PRA-98 / G3) TaxID=412133 RepID=A2EZ42_TRIV3|nr:hypothetical protein TVAGG3_0754370 [Trichomonas vaginalis G3]EAY02091.1 hypothetical protein TVAG_485260 [Trichomonas vaginalis G3]KAI5512761.1 hypothetical protein TVAGG3_0754370 [Trichomonas vaginalis G3]|eukprot:XP_001330846.1 hypothetical protein [Trichomonas vaginalis G3]
MQPNSNDVFAEISRVKLTIKGYQKQIASKRSEIQKLKSQNIKYQQKLQKTVELDMNNFVNYNITAMGQAHVEKLYEKKQIIENLEKEFKKLEEQCNNRRLIVTQHKNEGFATTKKIDFNKTKTNTTRAINNTSKIEKSYDKIHQLDKKIEAKSNYVKNLQSKISSLAIQQFQTKESDDPETLLLINDIRKAKLEIEKTNKNIEDLQLSMKYQENPQDIPIDIQYIDENDAEDIQEQLKSMQNEIDFIENETHQTELEIEQLLENYEELSNHYRFISSLPKTNKNIQINENVSVQNLVNQVKKLAKIKSTKPIDSKTELLKEQNNCKKLEEQIEQKKRLLTYKIAQLYKTKFQTKQKIENAKNKIKELENRIK